jgi:hypothetical protein
MLNTHIGMLKTHNRTLQIYAENAFGLCKKRIYAKITYCMQKTHITRMLRYAKNA